MSDLLSHERFGGNDLWIVSPRPTNPLSRELEEGATELARRGGGTLYWWVTAPTKDHEQAALEAGFEPYRRLHRMERPLPIQEEPYSLGWRPFRPGHDDAEWLEVNRLSFAAHPIQGTMTQEDLDKAKAEPWFDPDGFLLSSDDGRMSGFCWTKIDRDVEPPVGEIYIIGAHPDYHGRGIGRALVLAGLDWMAERDVPIGMLYVEADNEAAVRLYFRLGFEIVHDFRSWQRVVAPA